MPLNLKEILVAVAALETVAQQVASVSESEIVIAMSQIRTNLQTIVDSSDRVIVLEHLLKKSTGFQDWIGENLPKTALNHNNEVSSSSAAANSNTPINAEVPKIGMIKICVFLVALYEQNKAELQINPPQADNHRIVNKSDNLRKILQTTIAKNLHDSQLSAQRVTSLEYALRPLMNATAIHPLLIITLPLHIAFSPLVTVKNFLERTSDVYKYKCEMYAKILTDMLLLNNTEYLQNLLNGFWNSARVRHHKYTLFSMQTVNVFHNNEENENWRHSIYVGTVPDNNALRYQTHHSNGIQHITRAEFSELIGDEKTEKLFTALNRAAAAPTTAQKIKILKPFLEDVILKAVVLRGHAYYSERMHWEDLKLIKNIIWSTVLKQDPAIRIKYLMDMLDPTKFSCQLMDLDRYNNDIIHPDLRIFSPPRLRDHQTSQGTRAGILDQIDKAADGCVAQTLVNASTLPEPLRQALYTHQLNQFVKELNSLLTQYDNSKIIRSIDLFRQKQIKDIRAGIQQAHVNGLANPQYALNTLLQLVSDVQYAAQNEHRTKNNIVSRLVKPQSQLSHYLSDARKDYMQRSAPLLASFLTPEVAYLFLHLSCSFLKDKNNKNTGIGLPLDLIIKISLFFTGLSENQTRGLCEQYCVIFPKNPMVKRLMEKGKLMGTGIFTNVSTSLSKGLLSQEQHNSSVNSNNELTMK